MTEMIGSAPNRGLQPDFSRYVRRTFPQKLRGYSTADVDAHLRLIQGWFTLAGFEQLLADHREEILGDAMREAEATIEQAQREAETTIERARREAEATLEQARRESQTLLDEATHRARAITADAEQRLVSLKTLASAILEETDAQSRALA